MCILLLMSKTILFLSLLCWLICSAGYAQDSVPYPLTFTMAADQASYHEGSIVTFTATLHNQSTSEAFDILIPGEQNYGQKLISLEAWVENDLNQIKVAEEDLEMTMNVGDLSLPSTLRLAPGEKHSFKVIWNDADSYLDHTNAHHRFKTPVVAGNYLFKARYLPFGTVMGNETFLLADSSADLSLSALSSGKLAMPKSGLTAFAYLNLTPLPSGQSITVDGRRFSIEIGGGRYYKEGGALIKNLAFSGRVKVSEADVDSSGTRLSRLIGFYPSGKLAQYATFTNDQMDGETITFREDGSRVRDRSKTDEYWIHRTYDEKERLTLEVIIDCAAEQKVTRYYNPKKGKVRRRRIEEGKCETVLEVL